MIKPNKDGTYPIYIDCLNCGKTVGCYPSERRKFCNRKCGNNYNGTKFQNGHKQLNTGRTYITTEKVSGSKNVNWKGGITPLNFKLRYSNGGRKWVRDVLARDNYTYQMCFERGGWLEAHHIKKWSDYPELRMELSNGVALCKPCHQKTKKRENEFEHLFIKCETNHVYSS